MVGGKRKLKVLMLSLGLLFLGAEAQTNTISNPFIWADIPDISIVRVGSKYYMASTTMHMNPGVPIMESSDLVNWKTVSYCYQTIANNDEMNLNNGKNAYGQGSWASSIRYKNGTFYVLTPGKSSGKTHLYSTTDINSGNWKQVTLPFYHDPSLVLDDDGRNYIVYNGGDIRIVELNADLSGVKSGGLNKIIIPNATAVGGGGGLAAEGSQVYKYNGYYYVFLICWPSGKPRTELVFRSKTIDGTYEGKIALQSNGVAQGSIITTPDGGWYGYLFQDNGSVGRSPWLLPLSWANDWPVFGTNGVAPSSITMKASVRPDGYGIVTSDDFTSTKLPLEWQWNHNPVNTAWSLSARPGFMRITTSRTDADFLNARNSLTQRSYGPKSSGQIALETKGMKDGDVAGIGALQKQYGYAAVKVSGTNKSIVMVNGAGASPVEVKSVPITQDRVYLRCDMDFTNRTDKATFFYSLDGTTWTAIGNTVQMAYTIPHFMGQRFALFTYATKSAGGYADFDYFKIGKDFSNTIPFPTPGTSSSSSAGSSSSAAQTPYSGMIALPGMLQVENYDVGGQDVSYYDIDAENKGNIYRNDGVDLDSSGAAILLGYADNGEWLEYSVDVKVDGVLNYIARVASAGETGRFSLSLDNALITPVIAVPNTGGWKTFEEISGATSSVTKGNHILRINIDTAYFNIDWIKFDSPTTLRRMKLREGSSIQVNPLNFDLLGRSRKLK